MKLSQINFAKIKIPLVVDLIKSQMASGVVFFLDLKSTVPTENEIKKFNRVEDTFFVNHPIEKVFNHYLSANPSETWNGGKMVTYGFCLDKNSGEICYSGDNYPGAKTGQIFYIYLNFWGLKKIAVAQELIEINAKEHKIVFSYLEGGMTSGMQTIQFSSSTENQTKIVHTSVFKGISAFRDKFLYPYFHTKTVEKFHANLRESIEKRS